MSHSRDSSAPTNRLAHETSPYLLLHQHNPVDWYPWGEEAIARARLEDKPIFLSVGYSTCHWCHVMERESFSNPEIATLMNRHFVNVKVDREERPDLDAIYMTATQVLTEHGGWPNSVFLTPALQPFYAGTYFPPTDRQGRPGLGTLVVALADAWRNRRSDINNQAEELGGTLRRYLEERNADGPDLPDPEAARSGLYALKKRFDTEWGGFGSAPKFPSPANLLLLQAQADREGEAAHMLALTLDAMARGGIYDQLGGGFHRYATDREWKVPHFEKMLHDNGLLLELYAREHERTGDVECRRIALETAQFLAREMTLPEGLLASAVDADTNGHEGAFYVWTRAELEAELGVEDASFLAPLMGFEGSPFFEGSHYVLHLPSTWDEQAAARRMSRGVLLAEAKPLLDRLLAARNRRQHPASDDKALTDWNGTAIAGLAAAGRCLGETELVERAARAARAVLEHLRPDGGPLLHSYRQGRAKIPAFLSDYAFFIRGLLALDEAMPEARWLEPATELADEQARRLGGAAGGFYAAAAQPDLLFRTQEIFDGAMPSANGVATLNLIELGRRTGEPRFKDQAEAALKAFARLVERAPEAVPTMALAAHRFAESFGRRPAQAGAPRHEAVVMDDGGCDEEGCRPQGPRLVVP